MEFINDTSARKGSDVFFTPLTPLYFLKRSAHVFPEREAVIYDDKRYTYAQFYERVMCLANGLKNLGIEKGDKVAIISPNTPPMLEAHYGVPWIGASLVAINTRLSAKEISYIINHSDSRVVLLDTEFVPAIDSIRGELRVESFINIVDTEKEKRMEGQEYEEFLSESSPSELEIAVEDEYDTIAIDYTSGTTGLPKGVMYHHRGAFLNAIGEVLEGGMNSESVYLWTLPMFHCNGWCFTWGVTSIGGKHICLRRIDPPRIAELIKKEGGTHMCGAPTVYLIISQHMIENGMKFPGRVNCFIAGAPPSPTIIDRIESLGGNIVHVYGLTETYGPHSICEWHSGWDSLSREERARLKARQGVPYIATLEMRVVDDNMKDIPRDGRTLGEIVMRGNNVMMGYYKEKERTDRAFKGGWFHSGDLAVVHPDGYVEIKDRKKDVIISGGENISTVEIENVIYQHPDVFEAAVIAAPDEKFGEVPKAFVDPKPGASLTEEDIIKFCRERLARFKVPKKVEFGGIPKTSTGKVMKYVLREKEWTGYEKRVH